jgi:pyruvate dehydrogenase kinase 2/3/4
MSYFSKLYNKIFDYSLKKINYLKFIDMLNYRTINLKYIIPITTKNIYNELPIRLAKKIINLNNLPPSLSSNNSINNIRELYLISFEELNNIKEPNTPDDIIKFKNNIEKIYNRHSFTIFNISKGLYELKSENKINELNTHEIQLFLNNFYINKTEIQILLEQYLSFFENPKKNYFGIINFETNIEKIINIAINDIQLFCNKNYININLNDIIKINNVNNNLILPSIDNYLLFILGEIIKNSVYAIKEKKFPYIEILIKEIDINWILIKITDNGFGINEKNMEKIWYYNFTTTPLTNINTIVEQNDFNIKSPLSGFGYGLPISSIYINFLNSSKNNIKIFTNNNGSSVYIYLKRYIV